MSHRYHVELICLTEYIERPFRDLTLTAFTEVVRIASFVLPFDDLAVRNAHLYQIR